MTYERIAIISDVHGNLTALEAVLADIESRGITRIFNLGDYVGKGPRGEAVVDRCREVCEVNVRGNWDEALPDPDRNHESEGMRWWAKEIRADQGTWLRGLPFCHDFLLSGRGIRLFHASATSVHRRVHFDHDGDEFRGMFANTEATGDGPTPTVVGYGDIHEPYYECDQGLTLFNAGSVGNNLGDPTPAYAILEGIPDSPDDGPFTISFAHVPYDARAELEAARRLGMPELEAYESEILTGIYRGDHFANRSPTYHRA